MVVACAPWAESQDLLANISGIRCAAYLLVGSAWPEGAVARCYIGETADIARRLQDHAADPRKGFVSQVFVIGSRDPSFDKLDAQMLQFLLNARIEAVDRAHIVRGVKPALPAMDPTRAEQCEIDLKELRMLLVSAGCYLLETRGEADAEGAGGREADEQGELNAPALRLPPGGGSASIGRALGEPTSTAPPPIKRRPGTPRLGPTQAACPACCSRSSTPASSPTVISTAQNSWCCRARKCDAPP